MSQVKFRNHYKAYSKTYFVKNFWKSFEKKLTFSLLFQYFHSNSDLQSVSIKTADKQGTKFLAHYGGQTSNNLFAPVMANVFWKRFYPNFMLISC